MSQLGSFQSLDSRRLDAVHRRFLRELSRTPGRVLKPRGFGLAGARARAPNNASQRPPAPKAAFAEDHYRALFDSVDLGFCTIEVLFNSDGNPDDYRFVDVNRAFEEQTGLHNAVGRRMRQLAPTHGTALEARCDSHRNEAEGSGCR